MAEPIDPESPEREAPIRNIAENIGNINDDDTWRREVMASLKMIAGDISDISKDTMQMTNELSDISEVMTWFKDGIVEMGEAIMTGLNEFAAKFDELKDVEALRGSRDDLLERERMLEESRAGGGRVGLEEHQGGGGFLSKLMGGGEGIGSKIMSFLASPLAMMAGVFGLAISATKLVALGIIGAIAVVALWGALTKVTELIQEGRDKGLKGTALAGYVGKEMLKATQHVLASVFTALGYLILGEEQTENLVNWLSQPFSKMVEDVAVGILNTLTTLFETGILKIGDIEVDVIQALQDLSIWMLKTISSAIMGMSIATVNITKKIIPELIELAISIIKMIPKILDPRSILRYLTGIGDSVEIREEAKKLSDEVARIDGVIIQKYNLMREAIKNGNDEVVKNLQDDIAGLEEAKKELQESQKSWWTKLKDGYLAYNNEIRDAVLGALGIEHEDGTPMWFVNTTDAIKEKVGGFFDDIIAEIKAFDTSDLLNRFYEAIKSKITSILSYEYWFGSEKTEAPAPEAPKESIHPKNVQPEVDREIQVQPKVEPPLAPLTPESSPLISEIPEVIVPQVEVPDTSGIVVPPLPGGLISPASYKAMQVKEQVPPIPEVHPHGHIIGEPDHPDHFGWEGPLPEGVPKEPPPYGEPPVPPPGLSIPEPEREIYPKHKSRRDFNLVPVDPRRNETEGRFNQPVPDPNRVQPKIIKAGFTGTVASFLALGAYSKYMADRQQFKGESFESLGIDPNDLGHNVLPQIIPDDGVKKDTMDVVAEYDNMEKVSRLVEGEKAATNNIVRGGDTVVSNSVRNTFGGYPNAHIASKLTDTKTFRT